MSNTPFTDRARQIARSKAFMTMDAESGRARSHGWWRRLVEHGPWGYGYHTGHVGPPDREALDGIAKLFGTSRERAAEMVAAGWYGVRINSETSDRVLNLSHLIEVLRDDDAKLIESIVCRLTEDRTETPIL